MSQDTKTETKAMDAAPTPEEMNGNDMETKEEPLGAQVLRMLHEDFKMVLQNYDSVMGMLEHAGVRKMLEKNLMMIEKTLSEVETAFTKEYPQLPGLEDAMTTEEEELGETEREMEEPTAEEAVEGMQKKDLTPEQAKALRVKYRGKGMCPGCGMSPCICMKKDMAEEVEEVRGDLEETGEELEDVEDDLEPYEKRMVSEARNYLGELGTDGMFTDEQRMKAYHYYKTLDGIATLAEAHSKLENNLGNHDVPPATWAPGAGAKAQPSEKIDPEKAREILRHGEVGGKPLTEDQRRMFGAAAGRGDKAAPGTAEWREEEIQEPEHQEKNTYRKMCKDCGVFMKQLSTTTLLTDAIRKKAAYWHRSMEMMTRDERRAGAAGPEQTPAAIDAKAKNEPDTKALKELFDKQFGDLASLNEKLVRLAAV